MRMQGHTRHSIGSDRPRVHWRSMRVIILMPTDAPKKVVRGVHWVESRRLRDGLASCLMLLHIVSLATRKHHVPGAYMACSAARDEETTCPVESK